ncbi:carbohydrate ABC transporter permease [soil metagenome]
MSLTTSPPRRTVFVRHPFTVAFLLTLAIIVGFPLVWMLASSLRPAADLLASPPRLIGDGLSFEWYLRVFEKTDALRWITNSTIVALGTAIIDMIVGSLAAYAVTRFRFPGRELFIWGSLLCYVVPPILIFLPLYLTLNQFNLTNTHVGGIIAHVVLTLPFCLWLLQSFLRGVPTEIDEAAKMDGASAVQTFRLVILPLAAPGILAAGVLAFMISWSEYLLSTTILSRTGMKTVPVALGEMASSAQIPWGEVMVLGVVTAVPVLILFVLIQRWFVQGITAGAVKG